MDVPAHVLTFPVAYCFMGEALPFKHPVAVAFIGSDKRHIAADCFMDKVFDCTNFGEVNDLSHEHSLTGDSANYGNLAGNSMMLAFDLVFVAFLAADICLVKLDFAG